jgi:hypothetical protein
MYGELPPWDDILVFKLVDNVAFLVAQFDVTKSIVLSFDSLPVRPVAKKTGFHAGSISFALCSSWK